MGVNLSLEIREFRQISNEMLEVERLKDICLWVASHTNRSDGVYQQHFVVMHVGIVIAHRSCLFFHRKINTKI